MKKVYAYIGSGAGKRSHTYRFAQRILETAQEKDPAVTWEIAVSDEQTIAPCKSCNRCFALGECPQGGDIRTILEKLESADFVILGSPVYFHNVSGDMMRFIERLSYWSKDMRLAGKYGMAISTNSGNGHTTATSYLARVLRLLGVYVTAEENAAIHQPAEFLNEEIMSLKTDLLAQSIVDCLNGRGLNEPDELLEQVFRNGTRLARSLEVLNSHIYRSWKERGLFDYQTFSAYLEDRRHTGD